MSEEAQDAKVKECAMGVILEELGRASEVYAELSVQVGDRLEAICEIEVPGPKEDENPERELPEILTRIRTQTKRIEKGNVRLRSILERLSI